MTSDEKFQYAVFWEDDHCVDYVEIFNDEEGAARHAFYIAQETDGVCFGVQRSDGKTEPYSTWPMIHQFFKQEFNTTRLVAEPMRKIQSPFHNRQLWVYYDTPEWVGVHGVD